MDFFVLQRVDSAPLVHRERLHAFSMALINPISFLSYGHSLKCTAVKADPAYQGVFNAYRAHKELKI